VKTSVDDSMEDALFLRDAQCCGAPALGAAMQAVLLTMPLILLAIPVLSTLAGGLLALRLRRWRQVLVALSAGLLLGAAFLDLLPEALDLGERAGMPVTKVLTMTLAFLLLFTVLETGLEVWSERRAGAQRGRRTIGLIGGGMLIFHSFRDGMAIGAAFAASHAAGYAVACGIAAHDFGDGMNTVLLTTGGEKARRADYWFLAADAAAPFLGGLTTVWWLVSSRGAAVLLALAAGFFLQMATADFLPVVRDGKGGRLMVAVVAGAGFIWLATWLLS
jgi:zinc transporter ZupT